MRHTQKRKHTKRRRRTHRGGWFWRPPRASIWRTIHAQTPNAHPVQKRTWRQWWRGESPHYANMATLRDHPNYQSAVHIWPKSPTFDEQTAKQLTRKIESVKELCRLCVDAEAQHKDMRVDMNHVLQMYWWHEALGWYTNREIIQYAKPLKAAVMARYNHLRREIDAAKKHGVEPDHVCFTCAHYVMTECTNVMHQLALIVDDLEFDMLIA